MSNDLLAGDFIAGVNRKLIKKILVLTKAVLSLSVVYALIEIANWYLALEKIFANPLETNRQIFYFRIQPLVFILLFGLNIFAFSLNVKSLDQIDESIEHNDPDIFNEGFSLGYKAVRLMLISVCIAIATALTSLLLK
ncbi:MAG: hypothetical protein U0V75_12155 [Ferruginibacter sp.]